MRDINYLDPKDPGLTIEEKMAIVERSEKDPHWFVSHVLKNQDRSVMNINLRWENIFIPK